MPARLVYNEKVIEFPRGAVVLRADPAPPAVVNKAITGRSETILLPRVDVIVHAEFEFTTDGTTSLTELRTYRLELENWWQWAKHGNPFAFAIDPDESVYTTLSAQGVAGATSLSLADNSAVIAGAFYVLRDGPNYQMVRVETVGGGGTVTIYPSLDFTFGSGTRFRSAWYWAAKIEDERLRSPFRNKSGREAPAGFGRSEWFDFILDFVEVDAVVDEGVDTGTLVAAVVAGAAFSAESSGGGEETGTLTADVSAGATFVAESSNDGTLTAGASAGATFSATAQQRATVTAGVSAGATFSATSSGEGGEGFFSLFNFWQGGGGA